MVQNSLVNSCHQRNAHRFDPYVKILSLGILFLSPLAYRVLQPSLGLPCWKTLQRFVKCWPRSPGCSNRTIKYCLIHFDLNINVCVLIIYLHLPHVCDCCSYLIVCLFTSWIYFFISFWNFAVLYPREISLYTQLYFINNTL